MSSERLELLIAGYVLGDLSSEEVREFEQLLANNSAIAQEVMAMQQALEMSYAPPGVNPPSSLRSQVMAVYRASLKTNHIRRLSFFSMRTIGSVAAALIVALGLSNYYLWRSLQAIQAQVQQSESLIYLLQAKNASLSSASIAVNPTQLEATLNVKSLPLLPTGKVYVLWTVLKQDAPFTTDKKNAILTEVFKVDAQGNVSQQITVPAVYRTRDVIAAIAVTMEDAAAPQKHEGAPILLVKL